MKRSVISIAILVSLWLPAMAMAQIDTARDDAENLLDGADESAAVDFIEVIYNGQRIQVPIVDGKPAKFEIDGKKWNLQPSTSPPPATASPASPPVQIGVEVSPELTPKTYPQTLQGYWDRAVDYWNQMTVGTLGMMGVVAAMLAYYFLVEPMRRRRLLNQALRIIQQDQRPQFQQAEELLEQSLLAGLKKRDIARARFALGYLRARIGKYEEASTVLTELEKSGATIDQPAAYLSLWVQSKLGNHERVERIYNEHQKRLSDVHQTPLIVSISYLALARLRWARREINGAMHYFDEVRKLEVLADEIPTHIDDHEVVMGTMALFDRNADEAVKHFKAAVKTAEEREKATHPGQLGLLLCEWRAQEVPDIDMQLGKVLQQMTPADESDDHSPIDTECAHCGMSYRVRGTYLGKKVQCKECRRRFVVTEIESTVDDEGGLEGGDELAAASKPEQAHEQLLNDEELLLRNARLWHCLSLLFTWIARPERAGLDGKDVKALRKRVKRVREIDPTFGDADLIEGLIRYYFAPTEEERQKGRKLIDRAIDNDVRASAVLQLMDRENKLAALAENSLGYFHQLSQQYAENSEIDPQLRSRFLRRMNRFGRFRNLGRIGSPDDVDSVAPSVENIRGRGQILQTRLSNIVRHRLADEDQEVRQGIQAGLDELDQHARQLNENVKDFQQTELTLMESTGEFLFQDEEPLNADDSAKDDTRETTSSNGEDDGREV